MGDLPKVDEETEGKIVKWFRRQMWPARAFISQGRASFNDNIRFTDGRRIDDGVYLSRACKYGDFILFKKKEKGKHYCITHVRSRGDCVVVNRIMTCFFLVSLISVYLP